MPTPYQSHIDYLLTDQTIAYLANPANFVVDKAIPIVPVEKQSNRYPIWSRHDFARDDAKLIGPGSKAPVTDYSLSTAPYFCDNYALSAKIIWKERDASDDPAAYEFGKLQQVINALRIRRELLGVTALMTNTNWDSNNRLVGINGATAFPNFASFIRAGSDPIAVIDYAKDLIRRGTNGQSPTHLVVAPDVHTTIKNHSAIISRIQYGAGPANPALVTESMLAGLFGVDNYIVTRAVYSSSVEGASAPTYSDVASGTMALYYAPGGTTKYTPAAVKCFSWTEYDDVKNGAAPVFRWQEPSMKSDMIQAEICPAFVITAPTAGVHFASCLA